MSNDVIFLTFILIVQLIGLVMVWYQEIKPKLDDLYTKLVRLEQKVANVEHEWKAIKMSQNKWVEQINKDLSVESLNKIMQQHIDGTSIPIKNKIEKVVEEYNAHLTKLKENAYRIKKEAGTIKEILIYEEELDYIISHMNRLYGNSKKGA